MFILWLLVGLVSTLVAIGIYRADGTTDRKYELYLAACGPFFGPVVAVLLVLDLVRGRK